MTEKETEKEKEKETEILPACWYAVPRSRPRGDFTENSFVGRIGEYASLLRHHKLLVACSGGAGGAGGGAGGAGGGGAGGGGGGDNNKKGARVDWVRTNRFLAVTGRLCYQVCVELQPKQVLPFLQTHTPPLVTTDQLEELLPQRSILVAVMPLMMEEFESFIKWLHATDGLIQHVYQRCRILDVLCRGEDDTATIGILAELRQSMNHLIGVEPAESSTDAADDLSEVWGFSHLNDPFSNMGRAWTRQIVGLPKPELAIDAGIPIVGHSTKEQKHVAKIACAADFWFRDLVNLRSKFNDDDEDDDDDDDDDGATPHLFPLDTRPGFLDEGALMVYSVVDISAVRDDCRALIGVLRFLWTYDHTAAFNEVRLRMCGHPILAHAILVDPKSVTDLLTISGHSFSLRSLATMLRQCARTEVDNHVRLALPLSSCAPMWLSLKYLSRLEPLNIRDSEEAEQMLNQFVGGYLFDLDLSETVVTGSGIAMSTIITPTYWQQRALYGRSTALERLESLYPCVVTIPVSTKQYLGMLQQYKDTSEFRQDSHHIITLSSVISNNDDPKIGWHWASIREKLSNNNTNHQNNNHNHNHNHNHMVRHSTPVLEDRKRTREPRYGMRRDENPTIGQPSLNREEPRQPLTPNGRYSTEEDEVEEEDCYRRSRSKSPYDKCSKNKSKSRKCKSKNKSKSKSKIWLWSDVKTPSDNQKHNKTLVAASSGRLRSPPCRDIVVPVVDPRSPPLSPVLIPCQPPPRMPIQPPALSQSYYAHPHPNPNLNPYHIPAIPLPNINAFAPVYAAARLQNPAATATLIERPPPHIRQYRIGGPDVQPTSNPSHTTPATAVTAVTAATVATTSFSAAASTAVHVSSDIKFGIQNTLPTTLEIEPTQDTKDTKDTKDLKDTKDIKDTKGATTTAAVSGAGDATADDDDDDDDNDDPSSPGELISSDEKTNGCLPSCKAQQLPINPDHLRVTKMFPKMKYATIKEDAPDKKVNVARVLDVEGARREMVIMGEGEELQHYFGRLSLDWTFIDDRGPVSTVLSCKFRVKTGADVQLMVLTCDEQHLEHVAIQHFIHIHKLWPTSKLLKLQTRATAPLRQPQPNQHSHQRNLAASNILPLDADADADADAAVEGSRVSKLRWWYAVVDPGNVGRFRVVSIYGGSYRDLLLAPVGMVRGGYTRHPYNGSNSNGAEFFGSPTFALSALHSKSPNYVLSRETFAREQPVSPHECLLKYKMRGFGWPASMVTKKKGGTFNALQAWAKQYPEWSNVVDKTPAVGEIPATLGIGHFNLTDIIPITLP
jgi:hypothetical protein